MDMAAFVSTHSLFSFAYAITVFVLCLSSFSIVEAQKGGFSVELIHRDSPKSPFYNALETPSQRLAKALHRSISRVNHFVSPNSAQSEILNNNGEYLMKISIGTPAVDILAIADTGSNLIWTQCKPCTQCYKQDAPAFDPSSSTTYRDVSCPSSQCRSLEGTSCGKVNKVCQYSVSYGDNSYSSGNIAVDKLTLGSTTGRPVAFPNTVFGCGHNNGGTLDEKATGIVGLGGGKVSLISQMNSSIGGKFSYCLVPISQSIGSSKINFGSNAVVSGSGVVSTPSVSKYSDTFYFLTLEAISVGSKKINFIGSSFGPVKGNTIIDSGTTLTLLPQEFYKKLESAVSAAINATRTNDPNQFLSLCYRTKSDLKVPNITVHFSGADVKLEPLNTFVQISEEIWCFAFRSSDSTAIYGNLAQVNFLVGYDTEKRTVSFKPTDCTKQ